MTNKCDAMFVTTMSMSRCKVSHQYEYIENTKFMYFDIKFIRRDQKTRRDGEACPSHSAFSGQA